MRRERPAANPQRAASWACWRAACGIGREEPGRLEPLNALRFGVRVDQEGALLVDYHTGPQRGTGEGETLVKVTAYQTKRHYLADAIFLVGLESRDAACLHGLAEALRRPAFPLFLGRRSCPPTLPVCLGVREADLEAALQAEPLLVPAWRNPADGCVRMVLDAGAGEPGAALQRGSAPLLQPDAPAV